MLSKLFEMGRDAIMSDSVECGHEEMQFELLVAQICVTVESRCQRREYGHRIYINSSSVRERTLHVRSTDICVDMMQLLSSTGEKRYGHPLESHIP